MFGHEARMRALMGLYGGLATTAKVGDGKAVIEDAPPITPLKETRQMRRKRERDEAKRLYHPK